MIDRIIKMTNGDVKIGIADLPLVIGAIFVIIFYIIAAVGCVIWFLAILILACVNVANLLQLIPCVLLFSTLCGTAIYIMAKMES